MLNAALIGVLGAAWFIIGLLTYVAQFGWVVTFGMEDRFRSLGLGGPVIMWLASYLILQVLMLATMMLIPLGVTLDFSELVFETFLTQLPAAMAGTDRLPLQQATHRANCRMAVCSYRNHRNGSWKCGRARLSKKPVSSPGSLWAQSSLTLQHLGKCKRRWMGKLKSARAAFHLPVKKLKQAKSLHCCRQLSRSLISEPCSN